MTKIKSKGSQTFNVPNTPEGKAFIKLARQFAVKGTKFVSRGRAKNRKALASYQGEFGHRDIRLQDAEWIAFYVNKSRTNKKLV